MEIIYLLIPLSIILVALIIGAFLWSVRSGQFDDMQGPAHRILMDDDDIPDNDTASNDRDSPSNDNRQARPGKRP